MFEDLKPHLVDLRKRLLISVITLVVMFFLCFAFWEPILNWMIAPLNDVLPKGTKPVFIQVGEAFLTAVKVAFFAALVLSMPIIFWQLWLFIAPGLYSNEKKLVLPFVFSGTFMFLCGSAFAYYVVFPYGLSYLINFGSNIFNAMPSIGYYATFFAKLMIGFGIAFELPVICYFLAKLGLITDKTLIKFFRIAIVLIFVLAAFLTPPEVTTQILMAIPLILLYGVSIIIVRFVNPEKNDEEEDSEIVP
ncbi:twin-arginine translocase subunit TatC [Helicobacter sp. 16-1353]|uniref:twin-arginine translocase subunit TatC n=1 Tax=Helicobacter sp. 16-1353 TaxID=2004996 RepID=UPI000DCAF96D|nr:twin-arginine translocase subunit TatC [Helicobacter sp. 16-1353]RAX51499.1 twin-arginine translocase subunit TatC [Helicobacter sp. 16-1353]